MSLVRRRPPKPAAGEGTTFGEGACTLCRSQWTAWSYEPQLLGAAPEYVATIYRCGTCGAYGEEGLTYPHTITLLWGSPIHWRARRQSIRIRDPATCQQRPGLLHLDGPRAQPVRMPR
jgi:hypothetical protein